MIPLLALLIIVGVALLLVQLGANALILTGMSRSAAQFQAASAFFGVGFTTSEAEMVVDHPVRRRIVLHLIVAGNIGITSALATLVVTLIQGDTQEGGFWLMVLLAVCTILGFGLLLNVQVIKKPLDALMCRMLTRAGVIRALDYDVLLNVQKGFEVAEVDLLGDHPFAGKTLGESRPSDMGIVVLGIYHSDESFEGAPDKNAIMKAGDAVMIYGSSKSVRRFRNGEVDLKDGESE